MRKRNKNLAEGIDPVEAKILGMEILSIPKGKNKIKAFGVSKDEIFTPKTLWKVKAAQGHELVYTGFEVAQMMSVAAKEKVRRGCKKIEDNGYCFSFFKETGREKEI